MVYVKNCIPCGYMMILCPHPNPDSNDRGHIVLDLSVCLYVHLTTYFNITLNFWCLQYTVQSYIWRSYSYGQVHLNDIIVDHLSTLTLTLWRGMSMPGSRDGEGQGLSQTHHLSLSFFVSFFIAFFLYWLELLTKQ